MKYVSQIACLLLQLKKGFERKRPSMKECGDTKLFLRDKKKNGTVH